LAKRLALDFAIGVNIAVFDLNPFTRQTNNSLDDEVLAAETTKGDDLPTLWWSQLKRSSIDQNPITPEHLC
jgi:hypothetical protein